MIERRKNQHELMAKFINFFHFISFDLNNKNYEKLYMVLIIFSNVLTNQINS